MHRCRHYLRLLAALLGANAGPLILPGTWGALMLTGR
jgi:hypothetical protein